MFERSCMAAVCENKPIMLKNIVFYKTNKSWTVSPNELFQILPLFTSPRGKVPPICDALRPISINTALSEKLRSAITGDKYDVRCHNANEALQVLCFGMH